MPFSGTVIFVPGTGVRLPQYQATLGDVKEYALKAGLVDQEERVQGLPWFLEHGVTTDRLLLTIPPGLRDSALPAITPDPEFQLWGLLNLDPLTELRFLASRAAAPQAPVVGLSPVDEARSELEKITSLDVQGTGLSDRELWTALKVVLASAAFEMVVKVTGFNTGAFLETLPAVARAVVAQSLLVRAENHGLTPNAAHHRNTRRSLEEHVAQQLKDAVQPLFVFDAVKWISQQVIGVVQDLGMRFAEQRRAQVLDMPGRFVGDLAWYLREGQTVRDYLSKSLKTFQPPLLLMGHSLGGIMLVDMLSGLPEVKDRVKLLVTVGSQSPVLYLMNALTHLRPDQNSGDALTVPWLNVYDPRDFLAYHAGDVFSGVVDREVSSGVPFPQAHSAYWTNPALYNAVLQELR